MFIKHDWGMKTQAGNKLKFDFLNFTPEGLNGDGLRLIPGSWWSFCPCWTEEAVHKNSIYGISM